MTGGGTATAEKKSLKLRILEEFEPSRFVPNLMAGFVVGIIVVIVSISLATLIFSGELAQYLPDGIGLVLYSGIIVTGLVSLTSSYSGMIAYPQERVAPILAVIATFILSGMSGHYPTEQIFLTVVAAITLASLTNGIFLSALGFFKLGGLIRFIPYPVIGGFLAGTGWLLVRGSIGVMSGLHVSLEEMHHLFETAVVLKWGTGVVFGIVMVIVTHRISHFLTMPALVLGGVAVFYIVLLIGQWSPTEARNAGWLLGPFPEASMWKPLSVKAFSQANWSAISAQTGNLATILLISVVSVLLNSGALELIVKKDIDLNRELKVSGASNLLVALGGGTVGFHSLAISRLVNKMGADSRLVGVVAAIMCALMLLFGTAVLEYLPRLILGGLLFYLGMHFLVDGVYDAWFRLTKADYAVVIMILAFVGFFGYLHGVVVGIIACVILFLVNYSRVDVVKHALTGENHHSNVDRPTRHFRILHRNGQRLYIFKLQGFIFFGTANGLLEQVRKRIDNAELPPLQFMILDFSNVSGIDSSSTLSFIKMKQLAEKNGFTLIFTHLSSEINRQLQKEGFDEGSSEIYRTFTDLDYAEEWCENQILDGEHISASEYDNIELHDQLRENFPEGFDLDKMLSYFERLEVEENYYLMRQNDPAKDLFLIEKGQVTAKLILDEGKEIRLRTMCPGTIVGEVGLILKEPRSATVVTDRPSTIYRLSAESLKKMNENDPGIAVSFHNFITRLIAERLANANKAIQSILE